MRRDPAVAVAFDHEPISGLTVAVAHVDPMTRAEIVDAAVEHVLQLTRTQRRARGGE